MQILHKGVDLVKNTCKIQSEGSRWQALIIEYKGFQNG
jgi:hypothetical protein